MSINLSKGEQLDLSKEVPLPKKLRIALGWDFDHKGKNFAFELDVSVFMLGINGKLPDENYFVFYNNLQSQDGSVKFLEDSQLKDNNGDDETIEIDLSQVNPSVQEIVFVVTIYDVEGTNPTFKQVRNSFIRIYDNATQKEMAKYELDEQFSTETAIEFGRLYQKEGAWRFQAVGQGYHSELESFVDKYAS
jgi:tellurium resistance protein TerD